MGRQHITSVFSPKSLKINCLYKKYSQLKKLPHLYAILGRLSEYAEKVQILDQLTQLRYCFGDTFIPALSVNRRRLYTGVHGSPRYLMFVMTCMGLLFFFFTCLLFIPCIIFVLFMPYRIVLSLVYCIVTSRY